MILTTHTLLHLQNDRHRNYRLNSIEKPKETEVPSQCPGETFFSTLLHCVRFSNFLSFLLSSSIKLLFRKNKALVKTFIFTSSTKLSINLMKKDTKSEWNSENLGVCTGVVQWEEMPQTGHYIKWLIIMIFWADCDNYPNPLKTAAFWRYLPCSLELEGIEWVFLWSKTIIIGKIPFTQSYHANTLLCKF